ncbi:hypothetical protein [Erwinia billingiae]|uniref:hypothetical protein n=1 Tax=Erwinia billingiae TaxID=182337 RepID=UPI0022472FE5|nr:hypothetical protein [Erwinia billingiae]MCX0501036.1 hypothetical protein [Erwinia billingiae]
MNGIKTVVVIALLTSSTSHVMAQETSGGTASGAISFQGAIVESGCDMSVRASQVQSICSRQGKKQLTTSSLMANQALPKEVGRSDFRWLDPAHKLGELTVNYN